MCTKCAGKFARQCSHAHTALQGVERMSAREGARAKCIRAMMEVAGEPTCGNMHVGTHEQPYLLYYTILKKIHGRCAWQRNRCTAMRCCTPSVNAEKVLVHKEFLFSVSTACAEIAEVVRKWSPLRLFPPSIMMNSGAHQHGGDHFQPAAHTRQEQLRSKGLDVRRFQQAAKSPTGGKITESLLASEECTLHADDDQEARQHKILMRQFLSDQIEEEEATKGFKATRVRPLLMPAAERQKLVRELATRMGGSDNDSARGQDARRLMGMLESEDRTHVGVEIGVQVVAELLRNVVHGVTTCDDLWRVMSALGVLVSARKGDDTVGIGRLSRNAVVKVQAVQGDYLVLVFPQLGLAFKQVGYVRMRHPNGRQNMLRITKLPSKLPMMELLTMLSRYRHACIELAKLPRLIETLTYWMTQKGDKQVQGMAFQLLQRLQTAAMLLRGAGDGGHIKTMRRSLLTCSVPVAAELHALRTNKAKFPPQELDVAIVMTDGSPSQDTLGGAGGVADKRRVMPDHLKPVPLTYGVGMRSILDAAPKNYQSLRYQAAPMVLAPPYRPYISLIAAFPIDSSVCTFDRVRI